LKGLKAGKLWEPGSPQRQVKDLVFISLGQHFTLRRYKSPNKIEALAGLPEAFVMIATYLCRLVFKWRQSEDSTRGPRHATPAYLDDYGTSANDEARKRGTHGEVTGLISIVKCLKLKRRSYKGPAFLLKFTIFFCNCDICLITCYLM
jgi:hypothetical protein